MVAHSSLFTLLLSALHVSLEMCSAMQLPINTNVMAELHARIKPVPVSANPLEKSRNRAANNRMGQDRFKEIQDRLRAQLLSHIRPQKHTVPKTLNVPTMATKEIEVPVVKQDVSAADSNGACTQVPVAPVQCHVQVQNPVEPAEEKLEVTTPKHEFAVECTMEVDDEVLYDFFDGREGKVTFGKKIIIAELFASPRHPEVYHASHLATQGTQTCYYDVNACQATFEIKETVMREEKTFWGRKKMKEGIQVIKYIYKLSDTDTSDEEDFREDFRQACEVYCSENNNVKIQFM